MMSNQQTGYGDKPQATLKMVPTAYPDSSPLEATLDRFWSTASCLEETDLPIAPPEAPLQLLEQLGPSPFERGGFPLIGFLATTYEKVSRYALQADSEKH